MKKFIIKKLQNKKLQKRWFGNNVKQEQVAKPQIVEEQIVVEEPIESNDANIEPITEMMDTKEKIKLAAEILETQPKVKRIKKEKGLIERDERTKTILTEDNRELLID